MGYRTRSLNQTATHWANAVPDGRGWFTFDTPVTISCRWEDTHKVYRNQFGEEKISESIVNVAKDISFNDYLALGDYTNTSDPKNVSTARKVEQFDKIPDIKGTTFVGIVYL